MAYPTIEEKYESYLNSIKETLLVLKNEIENEGLRKAQLEHLIFEKENGLKALLALTGFQMNTKNDPRIIVESSFLVTTSSGQGDKSKTEISIDYLLKEHYPKAKFIGFVDGIGWYVRKGDLKRMIASYEDVFTFHKDELERFEKLLITEFKK